MTSCIAILMLCVSLVAAQPHGHVELITDRSGASEACGPAAVRWGFMCPIAARFHDHVYALNFTRPANEAWDALTPIEAPIAFWSRNKGKWNSILLDSPHPTYQTPTLLISPDGRANVFTLRPADSVIEWFRGDEPSNASFTRTEIPMGWGSYMSGAIDEQGHAALVYWGNAPAYGRATIGCTLVDTIGGKWRNVAIDSPGAPYCYNQVFYNRSGLHILGIRSIVAKTQLCGTRNHYTELRYYHCADPLVADAKWQHVVIMHNDQGCMQPLGNLVDPSGRVHLLYQYALDDGHGNRAGPWKLVYAASREPVSAARVPAFIRHPLPKMEDGRLFLTRDGAVHILAYETGTVLRHARVIDSSAGKLSNWDDIRTAVPFNRIFPIGPRNGSTKSDDLAAVLIGAPNRPEKNSLFYWTAKP